MSRELDTLIESLEARRHELHDFMESLREEVQARRLSQSMADEIFRRQYGAKTYTDQLTTINAQLAEAHDIRNSQRKELAVAMSPGVVVIVIGLALVFSLGGITGFFTFSDESFYQYDLGTTVSADTDIPLPFTQNISSLRMSGAASGTGSADVYVESNGKRYLVAHFDANEPEPSLLTGLFTADTSGVDIIAEIPAALDQPTVAADAAVTQTNQADPTQEQELLSGASAEESGASAPEEQLASDDVAATSESTSDIPSDEQPISPPAELPADEQSTPEPAELLAEPVDSASTPEIPVVVLPGTKPAAPQEQGLVQPRAVEFDNECQVSCALPPGQPPYTLVVVVRGDVTLSIDTLVFGVRPTGPLTPDDLLVTPCAVGDIVGDQECLQSASGTFLLTQAGQGRFAIQSANNTTVAVFDKYGTLALAGSAHFGVSPPNSGWIIQDGNNTTVLSIDETGTLYAAGSLAQQTVPTQSSEGDFIIQDRNGAVQAVLTHLGDIQLTGSLYSGVVFS